MSVAVGDLAPTFTLPGTGERDYSLEDYRGRPVVLVFYPGDDTPVCTVQLNTYTKDIAHFAGLDAHVIALEFRGEGLVEAIRPEELARIVHDDGTVTLTSTWCDLACS